MRDYVALPLVLVLAFFGMVYVPSTKKDAKTNDNGAKASAAEESSLSAEVAFLQPLDDFIHTQTSKVPDNCWIKGLKQFLCLSDGRNASDILKEYKDRQYKIKFLLATVPDPVESQFGYWFDSMVDAMQRAVESSEQCVLDRYWYPWSTPKKKKRPGSRKRGSVSPGSFFFGPMMRINWW